MKKLLVSLTLVLTATFTFAQDDMSVEQIIDTYLENIGGTEALSALKGHKITAEVDAQGMTIPLEMYFMKDGRMVTKFTFQGMEITQGAFDGETSWSTNFMSMKPEKADAEDSENAKRSSHDYPDPFLNYKDKGYTVELLGKETVEGVECFKVKLTKNPMLVDGEDHENVEFYYFDTETVVPIQSEQEILSGEMKGQVALTVYSDYQEVEGIYFPFSITYKSKDGDGQTIEFDTMELNPEVDETIFEFPGEE